MLSPGFFFFFFFLEYFHGNELLVCFIKTSLRNVFTGSRRFASQILQSRPPARSALRNHVVLYIFLLHLSDFQPLAQYSPASATKRAEHTESSLIRAFAPSLRLPPSGNRFVRGLAEGTCNYCLLICCSSTAKEQMKVCVKNFFLI